MIRHTLFALFLSAALFAEQQPEEIAKISEAFGHLIGKNMKTTGIDFDLNYVVKGLRDAAKGKDSPLSESECIEALTAAQEKVFEKKAAQNLAAAEVFLKKNAADKKTVSLEGGKIQYKVEKKGSGAVVKEGSNPRINYVGTYLNGVVFGKSEGEQVVSLDGAIPGFTKGLIGMKEGEKRTLHIHPEFGYGTSGYLPPNSLLTFEIELVKANTKEETFTDALILESNVEGAPSSDPSDVR